MLNHIIAWALRNRMMVVAMTCLITVWGLKVISEMPIDVFPDLNRPTVTIMTESEGMAPEEVEILVTLPIEAAMNGISGVSRVRSTSGIGLSIVYVEFDWKTDLLINRQLVNEKLSGLRDQLPKTVNPSLAPISSIMGEIMLVGLSSDTIAPIELRTLADWSIRPRLMAMQGVAQVISIGGGVKQYQIQINPLKLKDFNISWEEATQAIAKVGVNSTGGFTEDDHQEYLIRNIAAPKGVDDLARLVVGMKGDVPIFLPQVANIVSAPQTMRGDASVNGQAGVIMSIQKQPGTNTVVLDKQIDEALESMRKSLPGQVKLQPLFRQAHFIEAAVRNVEEALRDGAILVTIVLFMFLLNFRTTAITLTAIPLSFVVTAIVFKLFGLNINTMTLGGLAVAIGELVDDAIVDVENVFRRLRENREKSEPDPLLDVIFRASSEVRNSIVIATVIVILVFIPLFSMSGIEGRLFVPLGIAYVVSILASLLVSLTVTPVMCSYLLTRGKITEHSADGRLVTWLKRQDEKLLNVSLTNPRIVVATCGAVVIGAAISVFFMGREFLPPFNEGTVTISLLSAPGTSLKESNRIGTIAEKLLLQIPEVVSVGRRTGRAEQDEHAEGVHSSEIDVDLKPSKRSRAEILANLRSQLDLIPGVGVGVGQPISHRLDHLLSGVRAQIALKIFGPDLSELRSQAQKTFDILKTIPGVTDLQVERMTLIPQVQVVPDRSKMSLWGINPGSLSESLELAFLGRNVGQILEGTKSFNINLRMSDEVKSDPILMERLPIDASRGRKIPLGTVASVQVSSGPNAINHENGQRRIVVSANTQGRDLGSVVQDMQQRLDAQLKLPEGYRLTLGGQFESQISAAKTIALLSILSLAGVFAVLYSSFGSAWIAAQGMLNIPLALIGSVVAVFMTGGTFSVATLVGFVTLCGIASRNGIMMISHYLHLMAFEGESFSRQMIVRGSLERLVPVLMTALTAGLALIPLVLAADQPGKEILHPVAVVILGGLISSTLLDMAVTPAVFYAFGRGAAEKALVKLRQKEEKRSHEELFR